jgi:hypothetical protein
VALGKNPVIVLMTFGAFALWSPWSLPANVFSAGGVDPRSYVAQNDALWRVLLPVGTVTSGFFLRNNKGIGGVAPGMGTAFMVSPCYAMTSYHVLFGGGDLTVDPMGAYPVTLRFGLSSGGKPALSVKGRVRYWGSTGSAAPDVALVRLDGCPGAQLGWYDLTDVGDGRELSATTLAMPSVSRDRSMKQLSVQQGCRARAYVPERGWLLHDCATRQGASGAPLIANLSGVPAVVGINAGEFRATPGVRSVYDPRHANLAVAASWVIKSERIQAMLQEDRDRAQCANPLL